MMIRRKSPALISKSTSVLDFGKYNNEHGNKEGKEGWFSFFRKKGESEGSNTLAKDTKKRSLSSPDLIMTSKEAAAFDAIDMRGWDQSPPRRPSIPTSIEHLSPALGEEVDCDCESISIVSEVTMLTYSAENAQWVMDEFVRRVAQQMQDSGNTLTLQDKEAILKEVQLEQQRLKQEEKEKKKLKNRCDKLKLSLGDDERQLDHEAYTDDIDGEDSKDDLNYESYKDGLDYEGSKDDLDYEGYRDDLHNEDYKEGEFKRNHEYEEGEFARSNNYGQEELKRNSDPGDDWAEEMRRVTELDKGLRSLASHNALRRNSSISSNRCGRTRSSNIDESFSSVGTIQRGNKKPSGRSGSMQIYGNDEWGEVKFPSPKPDLCFRAPSSINVSPKVQEAHVNHKQETQAPSEIEAQETKKCTPCNSGANETVVSDASTINACITDIIELKVLVANQQATIDTLTTKLHNLERQLANTDSPTGSGQSKIKNLEVENQYLTSQLLECEERELSFQEELYCQNQLLDDSNREKQKLVGTNADLAMENEDLRRQLQALQGSMNKMLRGPESLNDSNKTLSTAATSKSGSMDS
mmetsp:Transcript_4389/g.9731  ORF Transcript_4389/g.9731 Transcript_4389/m.9731 type:complete len:581 (-) Transcript_4389:97-1839(-)